MPSSLSAAETEFIEKLGLLAESRGQTRITGRIWALLIVSGKALAPAEIAELLKVSRASAGTGLKVLESLELLAIKTRPGERQSYFEIREKPYAAMVQAQAKLTAENIAVVHSAMTNIRKPAAQRGLQDLESFYNILLAGHRSMLDQLEESQS